MYRLGMAIPAVSCSLNFEQLMRVRATLICRYKDMYLGYSWRPTRYPGIHVWFCEHTQLPLASEVMDPRREPTTPTFKFLEF